LLSKISSLEAEIQVCGENEATCQSNLAKEKNFASFQKQKNQKLKKVIADTRKNNQILKNQLSQNQCDNSIDIIHQNEINKLEDSIDILKKQNEELKMKVEELEKERDADMKKSLQYQSENRTNQEIILDMKAAQSKLINDLNNCKTTDADYVISKQELKECNEKLEAEMKKNLQCESGKRICQDETVSKNAEILELKSKNTKIVSKHESESADHLITKQELQNCEEDLENEIQKNKNLQTTASTFRKQAQDCQNKLEDEIEAKEILQLKVESFHSSWSEWSACSKTCPGVKTRMDKCSSNNKETKPCSDNCSKSGEFVDS